MLEEEPQTPTPFSAVKVDWSRTRAWGEGGYYCRLCVNVAGREPQGIVAPEDYEQLLDELADGLDAAAGAGRRGRSARACSGPRSCGASSAGSRPT